MRELTILQSELLVLESECLQSTDVPSCVATAISGLDASATVDYNAACCTSISLWGESVSSCFEKSAPPCLDTSGTRRRSTPLHPSL